MNLTFSEMLCPNCRTQTMCGAGGQFGGRLTIAKVRCSDCNLTLMIVPMSKEYQYGITVTTDEERKAERIEKARQASALKLAEEINRINSQS